MFERAQNYTTERLFFFLAEYLSHFFEHWTQGERSDSVRNRVYRYTGSELPCVCTSLPRFLYLQIKIIIIIITCTARLLHVHIHMPLVHCTYEEKGKLVRSAYTHTHTRTHTHTHARTLIYIRCKWTADFYAYVARENVTRFCKVSELSKRTKNCVSHKNSQSG